MEPVKSQDNEIQERVRQFYDGVGWKILSEKDGRSIYQNTLHEDLRPVAQEYIHNCRLRVLRHVDLSGRFFLDAGSGPIQYSEYLEYSKGYDRRICLDISSLALKEARNQIGEHGLFVVGDVARLPFKANTFDAVVSLHTIHHLQAPDQLRAYAEFYRVLAENRRAVVVSGWLSPPIPRILNKPIGWKKRLKRWLMGSRNQARPGSAESRKIKDRTMGTYVNKYNADWLNRALNGNISYRIAAWRSLDSGILRFYFHSRLGGRLLLRLLFRLEDRYATLFGINGRYPMIIINKRSEIG